MGRRKLLLSNTGGRGCGRTREPRPRERRHARYATVSVDYRSLAVFTTRTFHHSGCDHLKLAESPKTQPAWLSFYLITPPCRTCFISTDFNDWLHQLRLFHQDCAPNMPITQEIEMVQTKPAIGRPRSLSREDLKRVLSLSKAGLGSPEYHPGSPQGRCGRVAAYRAESTCEEGRLCE